MESNVFSAIELVQAGCPAFFKFIAANETGDTGGHQCGFYIPKDFAELALGSPCVRGSNKDIHVKIAWNDSKVTDSRFVYYGVGTRNESRITQFGRGFEYLRSEYTGALVVFARTAVDYYRAFVFNSEEEIDEFLGALGLGPADANKLIQLDGQSSEARETLAFAEFIRSLDVDFPASDVMSAAARKIENDVYDIAAKALRGNHNGVWVSGEYVPVPSSFPAVTILESDNRVYQEMRTTTIENATRVTYECNVYSAKTSGKKSEAKAIANTLDDVFESLGFTRTARTQAPNLNDATIYRLYLRYEAVVDSDLWIYHN